MTKIVVVGLGSMGKRRLRLLKENADILLSGVDSNSDRRVEVSRLHGIHCYASLVDAIASEQPTAAMVCTSPLSHAYIICECLEAGLHVFTEINLVQDGYEENIALAKEKGKVLFLSSTFLYRKETQTIVEKVRNANCPLNYMYHVGQYLPDWHPWESYNNYFIGNPKTNGCREIMAIDLPWIVTAFGDVTDMKVMKSKNTKLNISYNDNYLIMFEHTSGAKGIFAVDVIARKPYRHIDVYGEEIQLSWDGTADSLYEFNIKTKEDKNIVLKDASEHIDGYAAFVTENPYREELNAFLRQIEDKNYEPAWNFEKDKKVLNLIDQIEA